MSTDSDQVQEALEVSRDQDGRNHRSTPPLASIDGAQVATSVPPPGGMILLPGYKHEPSPKAIDSRMGRIVKDNGPVISYDIGLGVGSFATPRTGDKTLWVKEISLGGGNLMRVNMQADERTLLVDIGLSTGFAVQQVATKEDLTEVLMMLMPTSPVERA